MKNEVRSAVDFLSTILRSSGAISGQQAEVFNTNLQNLLCNRFTDHWFPEKPFKGSGFRCIRLNHNLDPLLRDAGKACGLSETALCNLFPKELTLWIDPLDVSYRFGENGSVGVLYASESEQLESQKTQIQTPNQQHHQQSEMNSPPSQHINARTCKDEFLSTAFTRDNMNNLRHLSAYVYS